MTQRRKNIAVLGSTGSIGRSALDVIQAGPERFRALALSGHSNIELLRDQARSCQPRWAIATNASAPNVASDGRIEWLHGQDAICDVARNCDVDVVVAAIVGSAGLTSTWAALEVGKTVALANKETLVAAGPLVMELARRNGANIVPVDSEHSAIFQALQAGRRGEVRRVILTASGGPFREYDSEQFARITVDEALDHPTWQMGPKITVDSATMMNKALEIIEARWLFQLEPDQIDVVIHPQSIVHSLVEFVDGSVVAQMSPPDMRLPIQYALDYPDRQPGPAPRLDLSESFELTFEPPDRERFPALDLGFDVAAAGGTAGAVLNAANEAAVAKFLRKELAFNEIVPSCRAVLAHHDFDPNPSLDDILTIDAWARREVNRVIHAIR